MTVGPEVWLAFIVQTIVIIIAIAGAAVRTASRITRIETLEEVRGQEHEALEAKVDRVNEKVNGISRTVARIEGAHQTCPYANTPGDRVNHG